MHELDDLDRRIVRHLQEDPMLSTAELASRVGLSTAPCWRRLEKLERDGVIKGRKVDIDPRALGFEVQVFLRVSLDKTQGNALDEFIRAARDLTEITAIQTLLGSVDVRMDVQARDLAHYQQIYREKILTLPHINEVEALLLVSELKNSERVPV